MEDIQTVTQAFGGGGGQRADPDFNTKVARPAYAGGPRHPRVLFDEAHYNFHTASGRYKPFAELITSDGYQVIPNKDKFTRQVLQKGDILVIANALSAEEWQPRRNPAFTDAECDAVRDWVKDGGCLLLITDHAPFGSAAECLAKRFGVEMSKGAVGDPKNSEEGERAWSSAGRTTCWATTRSPAAATTPSGSTRCRPSPARRSRGPRGASRSSSWPIPRSSTRPTMTSEVSAAGRTQGLAFPFGKGRVVVMGEAAELSAQVYGVDEKMGMNVPGIDNRQMALNILHWLSGLLEPREAALEKAG